HSKHSGGFRIEVTPEEVVIHTGKPVGLFRALSKVWQMIHFAEPGDELPCLEIADYPVLKRRGFMLDISRCKVPTMEELFRLIDLLALIGYNELQLYIEHTFRFRDHEAVWKDASPLSGEEIRQLDQYCQERFIELVPNLNSFGHFERWLRHPAYRHMAECPDGFVRETPYIKRDHGTTLKPNQQSLDFIDSLYEEYLPNFSSREFNVGLDEPWELGQGWSRQEVENRGKGKVYLRHLEGIRKLVEKHGKHMQFWSDVLLEDPENAKLLDKHASPIIWGYEPTHPFEEQAAAIARCGLEFCLAPGTGTWKSFTGRWPVAKKNIELACNQSQKHGAEGILLTSWGDCGNHQPWPTMYPGMLHGAQLSWNGKQVDENTLGQAIDCWVYRSTDSQIGKALLEMGKLDQVMDSYIPNSSMHWTLLFGFHEERFREFFKEHATAEKLNRGLEYLEQVEGAIPTSTRNQSVQQSLEEIRLGLQMTRVALGRGNALLQRKEFTVPQREEMVGEFERLWRLRARQGGLREASELLLNALN
ncbi:MAG: beta-N-acetylhexosaminidase, partial [Verrucomicrobia bacterium]|nr:beta-N-acetylhexosaminidase [Verrucomicrobiota bacterium]